MYDSCLCVCVSSYLCMPFMRLKHSPLLKECYYARLTFTFWKLSSQEILGLNIVKPKISGMNLLFVFFWSLQRTKFKTHPENLPLSRHQRVHQQLGVLLGWNQSEWRSSKTWNSAIRDVRQKWCGPMGFVEWVLSNCRLTDLLCFSGSWEISSQRFHKNGQHFGL